MIQLLTSTSCYVTDKLGPPLHLLTPERRSALFLLRLQIDNTDWTISLQAANNTPICHIRYTFPQLNLALRRTFRSIVRQNTNSQV